MHGAGLLILQEFYNDAGSVTIQIPQARPRKSNLLWLSIGFAGILRREDQTDAI
jgi:hypothetical protein